MSASWVRIDASYFAHRKNRAMGKDGRALDIAGICWCSLNETDGRIPRHALTYIAGEAEVKPSVVKAVVAAGRWEETEEGWQIHDYLDYNRSADDIAKERNRWQRNKAKQRASSHMSTGDISGDIRGESSVESPPLRNGTERSPFTLVDNSHPSNTRRDDRKHQVIEAYAAHSWQTANQGLIRQPRQFKDSERDVARNHPELDRWLEEYPTARPGEIAAWLRGETNSMRYHQAASS